MTEGWPMRCMRFAQQAADQHQHDELGEEDDLRGPWLGSAASASAAAPPHSQQGAHRRQTSRDQIGRVWAHRYLPSRSILGGEFVPAAKACG